MGMHGPWDGPCPPSSWLPAYELRPRSPQTFSQTLSSAPSPSPSRGALSLLLSVHCPRTCDLFSKRCSLSGPSPPTGFSTPFTHAFFVQACTSRVSVWTVLGLHLLPLRVSPVDDAWRSCWFELPSSVFENLSDVLSIVRAGLRSFQFYFFSFSFAELCFFKLHLRWGVPLESIWTVGCNCVCGIRLVAAEFSRVCVFGVGESYRFWRGQELNTTDRANWDEFRRFCSRYAHDCFKHVLDDAWNIHIACGTCYFHRMLGQLRFHVLWGLDFLR